MSDDVMIDLETLSIRPTAAIISIGAVKFNPEGITDKFYVNVEAKSCKDLGLHIDPGTVEWWMKQSPAVRRAVMTNTVSIQEALTMFNKWFGPKSMPIWANGAHFDLPIMENAYYETGIQCPWKYWDSRCYRTILAMFNIDNRKVRKAQSELSGVCHNAADDAKGQAEFLIEVMGNFK